MALRLFGIAQSRAFRNLWLLEELGLPHEQVQVGFEDRKVVDPQLHAINPNRKLPVLDDHGFVLFESLAINLYLVEKHGGPLKWATAGEAGRCFQWTLWAATEIEAKAQAWGYAKFVAPDEKALAAAAEELHHPLSVLDGALTNRHYLAAERFTVADLNVASVMYRLIFFEDLRRYSQVKTWMDRCWSRPAAQKVRQMREG